MCHFSLNQVTSQSYYVQEINITESTKNKDNFLCASTEFYFTDLSSLLNLFILGFILCYFYSKVKNGLFSVIKKTDNNKYWQRCRYWNSYIACRNIKLCSIGVPGWFGKLNIQHLILALVIISGSWGQAPSQTPHLASPSPSALPSTHTCVCSVFLSDRWIHLKNK